MSSTIRQQANVNENPDEVPCPPTGVAVSTETANSECWQDVEEREPPAWRVEREMAQPLWTAVWRLLKPAKRK